MELLLCERSEHEDDVSRSNVRPRDAILAHDVKIHDRT